MFDRDTSAERRKRFKPDTRQMAAQILEGEAIIVNLTTGSYYSLVNAGAEIWAGIQARAPIETIVESLVGRYRAEPERVRLATADLVQQLTAEGLITPCDDAEVSDPFPMPVGADDDLRPSEGEFVPPILEKFEDMADLILLDPIHDVGEAGWPHPRDTMRPPL